MDIQKIDRILRLPEVIAVTGLSRTTIYDYIKNDAFPKQIRLTKQSVGWRYSVINEWLNSREH